jgi:hypothetical protein
LLKKENPPAVTGGAEVAEGIDVVVVVKNENEVASAIGGAAVEGAIEDAPPGLPKKENPVTAGAVCTVAVVGAGVERDRPLFIKELKRVVRRDSFI